MYKLTVQKIRNYILTRISLFVGINDMTTSLTFSLSLITRSNIYDINNKASNKFYFVSVKSVYLISCIDTAT